MEGKGVRGQGGKWARWQGGKENFAISILVISEQRLVISEQRRLIGKLCTPFCVVLSSPEIDSFLNNMQQNDN